MILQVVETPSVPVKPVSSRLWLLLIGVGVALMAAVAAVLMAEFNAVRALASKAGTAPVRTEEVARIEPV